MNGTACARSTSMCMLARLFDHADTVASTERPLPVLLAFALDIFNRCPTLFVLRSNRCPSMIASSPCLSACRPSASRLRLLNSAIPSPPCHLPPPSPYSSTCPAFTTAGKYLPHSRKRQEKIAGSLKHNWVAVPIRSLDEKTRAAVESTELPEPLVKPQRVMLKARHKAAEGEATEASEAAEEAKLTQ